MTNRKLHITDFDMERLQKLLEGTHNWNPKDRDYLEHLEEELSRAVVVPSKKVPGDVVTMNSQIRVKDLDTGKEMLIQLVFPSEADFERGKISILAPIGTALIGYRTGDTVEWKVPAGVRHLRIDEVIYQPEAAGDYHL
jgi:regulator of nucleoside diphosphate kinase